MGEAYLYSLEIINVEIVQGHTWLSSLSAKPSMLRELFDLMLEDMRAVCHSSSLSLVLLVTK